MNQKPLIEGFTDDQLLGMTQGDLALMKNVQDTMFSFNDAIEAAGGMKFTTERLRKVSLHEFLLQVAAPNGIRFRYLNPVSR